MINYAYWLSNIPGIGIRTRNRLIGAAGSAREVYGLTEKQLLLIERRVKKIDTKPLMEPLNRWDDLSMEEKNALAKVMINRVDITDEEGIKIHFSF